MQEGKSALMLVCEHGKISLLLIVLDGGADVNFQQQVTFLIASYLLYCHPIFLCYNIHILSCSYCRQQDRVLFM